MIQSYAGALGPMCCLEAGPLPSRVRSSRGHPLGKGRGTATGLQRRQEGLTGPGHPGPPAGWGKGAGPGCSRHRGDPKASGGGREVVQGHTGTPARPQQGVSGGNQGLSQGQAPVMGEGTHLRGLVSATNPAPAHSPQQGVRTAPPSHARAGDQAQRPQALPPPPAGCSPKSSSQTTPHACLDVSTSDEPHSPAWPLPAPARPSAGSDRCPSCRSRSPPTTPHLAPPLLPDPLTRPHVQNTACVELMLKSVHLHAPPQGNPSWGEEAGESGPGQAAPPLGP